MSFNKWVSSVLVLVILATPVTFGTTFNDLDRVKWAQPAIENMALNGYIGGYTDGTFKPSSHFTRAELVTIINKMNGFTEQGKIQFKDVNEDHWAYIEINKAVQAGYVNGYSDGTFRPNEPVSREQVATILNNLYHLENKKLSNPINDLSKISPWAVQAVVNCMANGIMGGYPDGSFGSKNRITRAEGVVALNKIVTNEIPTLEKWLVAQESKTPTGTSTTPTGTPSTPTSTTPPSSGTTGSPGTPVTIDQTLQKLEIVVNRMNTRVLPDLTTDLQRATAAIIIESISSYLSNQSYATGSDVLSAKANVLAMSNIEYQAFKNAITSNIILGDLIALNDVFNLIEY